VILKEEVRARHLKTTYLKRKASSTVGMSDKSQHLLVPTPALAIPFSLQELLQFALWITLAHEWLHSKVHGIAQDSTTLVLNAEEYEQKIRNLPYDLCRCGKVKCYNTRSCWPEENVSGFSEEAEP
jgi:hypothetical protein